MTNDKVFQPASTSLNLTSESAFSPFEPLRFDPSEFMSYVAAENLSEREAEALLVAIWEILVAFVDLHFDVHPVQQALGRVSKDVDGSDGSSGGNAPPVLSSAFQHTLNKQCPSTHAIRRAEAKEES